MKPLVRNLLIAGAAVVLIAALTLAFWPSEPPRDIPLGEFQSTLDDGQVRTAEILSRDDVVQGELQDGTEYTVTYPGAFTETMTQDLLDADVELDVDAQTDTFWIDLLYAWLPILLLIGVFVYFMGGMMGGAGGGRAVGFGKTKARKVAKDQPQVTFADVAGADEAVEELQEIKEFLENPAKFQAMGAKIPKGVLLFGPPGTGKTLLARAVAGEAGAPFFSISGSDFVEMFVGVGASRVRDLFDQAKSSAPAIIFVDEIDAVGRHRGAGLGGGHDEREQTLNQLLVEMDGFDVATGVILIAATNRPDILDPALLRPGRFDRQIVVDQPDLVGRRAILAVHAKGKPLGPDVNLDVIARRTPGFTGADLANTINESALLAARRGEAAISMAEVEEAIDRVMAGPERKSRVMSDKEKRVIAYHEAGHALVGHVLPNTDPIHKVSIVARGRALGWTLALPEEDRNMKTRSELRDEMAMLMGGRTAEELIFGDPTTGAQNDIERATQIARAMVTQFGMSDRIGPLQLGSKHTEVFVGKEMGHEPNYSDEVASTIDAEIRRLVDDAHAEAREILSLHRATLDQLADALVAHETLGDDQLHGIFGHLDSWETAPSSIGQERSGSTPLAPGAGRVAGGVPPSIPGSAGRSGNVTAAEGDPGSWTPPSGDDHRPDAGSPRFP